MKWEPIDTAPTKTPILITDGEIITVTKLDKLGGHSKYMFGHGFGGYEWEYDFEYKNATHWMPLPELPTAHR